jgi:DNA-binding NarL/FixJ family response regulator
MNSQLGIFVVSSTQGNVEALSKVFAGSCGTIVGSASASPETATSVGAMRPQICIIDADGPAHAYLECIRSIHRSSPNTRVVLWRCRDDVSVLVRYAAAKVCNSLPESLTPPEFLQAIADVVAGVQADPASPFGKAAAQLRAPSLHKKEQWFTQSPEQILRAAVRRCVASGLDANDIAFYYNVDTNTVRQHIKALSQKSFVTRGVWRSVVTGLVATALFIGVFKGLTVIWSLGARRIGVSGHVHLAGTPLDGGVIEFRSLDSDTAVVSGALIQDGRYSIPSRQGLLPGTYVVLISSPKPSITAPAAGGSATAPPAEERIPANFNSASSQRVEVRRRGRNVFDFVIAETRREVRSSGQSRK